MLGAMRITVVVVGLYTSEFAYVAALRQSEQISLDPGEQPGSLERSDAENIEVTNPGLGASAADRENGALDVGVSTLALRNRSSGGPEEYRDPVPEKEPNLDYGKGAIGSRRLSEKKSVTVDPSTRPAGSTCEVEPETATSTEEAADPSDCHMSSMDVPSWISFTQVTARTSLKVNATDLAHRTSAAMVLAMNSPATVLVLLLALLLFATGVVLCYEAFWKQDPKEDEERKSARAEAFPHHAKAESKHAIERSATEHYRLTAAVSGYESEVSQDDRLSVRGGRPCPWPEKRQGSLDNPEG